MRCFIKQLDILGKAPVFNLFFAPEYLHFWENEPILISGKMTCEKRYFPLRINFSFRTDQLMPTIWRPHKKEHRSNREAPSGLPEVSQQFITNQYGLRKFWVLLYLVKIPTFSDVAEPSWYILKFTCVSSE